jgi:hypothetical protein
MQFLAVQEFSLFHSFETDCGAHPTTYSMGIGVTVPRVKRQDRESDLSPPYGAKVKKGGAVLSLFHMYS